MDTDDGNGPAFARTIGSLAVAVALLLSAVMLLTRSERDHERSVPAVPTARSDLNVSSLPRIPINLAAHCQTLTAVTGGEQEREAACARLVTPDGLSLTEGDRDFRDCRDGILDDWLPTLTRSPSDAPLVLRLEASFACRHLWDGGSFVPLRQREPAGTTAVT